MTAFLRSSREKEKNKKTGEDNPIRESEAMESRIVISFSPLEAMQLERIALDKDKDAALRIVEKVILKKIREASAPH